MGRMRGVGRVSREGRSWGWRVSASLALAMLAASGSAAVDEPHVLPRAIEVFVASDTTAVERPRSLPGGISSRIYALDRIEQLEAGLSEGLPAEADAAQAEALRRLRAFDPETRHQLAQGATGLARAARYGLDRYPAIVFDGEAVVYGVTDLEVALEYYRAWRARAGP